MNRIKGYFFAHGLAAIFAFLLLCSGHQLQGQNLPDSTYYISNKKRLSLGIINSLRSYKINVSQKNNPDPRNLSTLAWQADAKAALGFSFDYDKLAVNIAFRTGARDQRKGNTDYQNAALSFGGNRILFEGSYRNYKGFYENNTGRYDSTFTAEKDYYQDPSMHAMLVKLKGMYFPNWKRFSYKAAYSSGYRQLKSSISAVISGSVHYEQLNSETSFAPEPVRSYYSPGADSLNSLNTFALSGGIGGSATLVLKKRLFLNLTVLPYLELQRRNYGWTDQPSKRALEGAVSADLRASLGYSSERFFILLYTLNDVRNMNAKGLNFQANFTSLTLNVGYRFEVSQSKSVQKIKNSNLYQKL